MFPFFYRTLRPFWPGGRILRSRQSELEKSQWWTREQLESWQLEQLKKLIRHAYDNVPYYSELYRSLDIHPEDIKSLKDFQALPFTTKEDINNHQSEFICNDKSLNLVPNYTGGSTGASMQFFMEKNFDWWDPALELRGRGWYGVGEGEKLAYVWGAKRDLRYGTLREKLRALRRQERYLNAFDMTEQKMKAFAETLLRWKPAMFRSYASALTLFAEYLRDHKIDGIRPKLIETTAEKVTIAQRNLLEEVFRCKVADWYTAREMGTIAFQCPAGGMHVAETRYLEIVANNFVTQPGELGEVVITSLHQYGMPFIRYKLGDMAIMETMPCSCGRGLQTLREVVGRLQDFLVTSKGHFVHGGYFVYTFMHIPEITRYQVYQPDKNRLEVRLVCNRKCDSTWLDQIHRELHERFGTDMQISVDIVENIPLTPAGKYRFIISDVKPDFV